MATTKKKTPKTTIIKNGVVVTLNQKRDVFVGDVHICDSEISYVGKSSRRTARGARIIDAKNCFVIPGLIQAHTHLCQTLFRGEADDLKLLDWLTKRIWPMEAAHSASSLRASARIGLLEMQKSGTTSILDMGTVRHTQTLLETAAESGIRYWGGKCLMDLKEHSGPLWEKTGDALSETHLLIQKWQNKNSLIHYVLCPRFAVSCTETLLKEVVKIQKRFGLLIHTHASESRDEIALIRERSGLNNVDYFAKLGLLNSKTVVVHGVHLTKAELLKMVRTKTPLVHCPSSNLKLGSGIAPIELYKKHDLTVSIGSDGAPCNNSMDPFIEMRLTALLQKPTFGPDALPAQTAVEMATLGGAKTLGAENEIGSLEVGKFADVITVRRTHPSVATVENPYSALVYSCLGRDVRDVFIHGRSIINDGVHQIYSEESVINDARTERCRLLKRLG